MLWRHKLKQSGAAARSFRTKPRRPKCQCHTDAIQAEYLYSFGLKEPWAGRAYASHAMEIAFVFHKLEIDNIYSKTGLPEMHEAIDPEGKRYDLRDTMVDPWSNFAWDGTPSAAKLPNWPAYSTKNRPTLRFGEESALIEDPLGPDIRRLRAELDVGIGS